MNTKEGSSLFGCIIAVIFFSLFFMRGCFVNEDKAVRALEKRGYSDAQVTDKAWFLVLVRGCDGTDAARFTVKAKNPAGDDTEVFVCTGWPFKDATIRTE